MRTVRAAGGTVLTPLDLYVARRPPTTAHFASQRVRQAYDDFAIPARRRAGGAERFSLSGSLLAPLWVVERSISSWLAVAARLRGGVRYGDRRLRHAATPMRRLRRRYAELSAA